MAIKTLEFYSGIGGLHRALQISNVNASVVQAFDWDQTSCRVYEANYGPGILKRVDISTLTASDLANLNAEFWVLSPSCQPYTVLNPNAKGADDPRAKSFLHLVQNVIPELTRLGRSPKWILIENVAGFESSSTQETLVETLRKCEYTTLELLLTPLQFGIPNSRLRYYLLGKRRSLTFARIPTSDDSQTIWRQIPGYGEPWRDKREECDATQLRVYLDPETSASEDHACKIPDRVMLRWGRLFDIVLPSSRRTCCFTRGYTRLVERAGSILQMNEELDTTQTFDEFLTLQKHSHTDESQSNQLSSEDALLNILAPLRLRYFSPSELLRLFHFEPPMKSDDTGSKVLPRFEWPADVSRKSKYRLLGNSVNVEVVRRLVNYLFEEDSTLAH